MLKLLKSYRVTAVPLFEDNYSYIIQGTSPKKLVLIDPANPDVILDYIKDNFPGYLVSHVLYTHKHWDHAGGSVELRDALTDLNPNLQVLVGEHDRDFVDGANHAIQAGEKLKLNKSWVHTIHVPCHTRGHTIYSFLPQQPHQEDELQVQAKTKEGKPCKYYESNSCTFTGDTLFIGGSGRFFEGSPAQMTDNFRRIVAEVAEDSDLFVGHEYTLSNVKWASQVEKDNEHLQEYTKWLTKEIQEKGQKNVFTIPSTLKQEKDINLFIRAVTGTPLLQAYNMSQIQFMGLIREMKNNSVTSQQQLEEKKKKAAL